MLVCHCVVFGSATGVLPAGEPALTEPESPDKVILEQIRDAYRGFRSSTPKSGYIRATMTRTGSSFGVDTSEVDVWWNGDLFKCVEILHMDPADSPRATQFGERRVRRTRIAGPDTRIVFTEPIGETPIPTTLMRGKLPHFDPKNNRLDRIYVQPRNAWYGFSEIGPTHYVDTVLERFLRSDFPYEVSVKTDENDKTVLGIRGESGSVTSARFDPAKGWRLVESRITLEGDASLSMVTRLEWVPDEDLNWRLAKATRETVTRSASDASAEQRGSETLLIHECQFHTEFPDDFFSCDQVTIPEGTQIQEWSSEEERPVRSVAGRSKAE